MRLVRALLTVWGVVTLVFLMVHLIPGDPIDAILGDQAAPEDRAALRRTLHLDRPLLEQYGVFVGDVANGTLGVPFRRRQVTVASLIAEVFPDTMVLAVCALGFALLLAVPLGAMAAVRHRTAWDRVVSTATVLGVAIPNIWLGPLLVLAFGVKLRWLPLPGDTDASLAGLVLPTVTLGTALMAILARQTRGALLEVLAQPYILAARARGLAPRVVLFKHALRNALLPVLTVAAAQFGGLLSGAVVTEKIFERPGLGTLFLDAFFDRDIPIVQGCVLVIACLYVSVNFMLDLAYLWVDPRLRLT